MKKTSGGGEPRLGFTLAEVLITLGIIGVVAAMTMPVLTANINDKVLENQNKKAQSVFANGIKMLMAKEDVTNLKDTEFFGCGSNKACIAQHIKQVFQVVEENSDTLLSTKYQFTDETKEVWNNSKFAYTFVTPDGIVFGILKNEDNSPSVNVIVDINGIKRPNKGGQDLCKYSVSAFGILSDNCSEMTEFDTEVCSINNLAACKTEAECRALSTDDGSGSSYQIGIWNYSNNTCSIGHSGGVGQ